MCESMTHSGSAVRHDRNSSGQSFATALLDPVPNEIDLPLSMPSIERITLDVKASPSPVRKLESSIGDGGDEKPTALNGIQPAASIEVPQEEPATISRPPKLVTPPRLAKLPVNSRPTHQIESGKSVRRPNIGSATHQANPSQSVIQELLAKTCSEENMYSGKQTTQVNARIEWENAVVRQLCDQLALKRPEAHLLSNRKGREQVMMSVARAVRERVGRATKLPAFLDV